MVRSDDRAQGLRRGLQLIGGLGRFVKDMDVLIKVNMAVARSPESGSTCDPGVLSALIDSCHGEGAASVVVADGSAVDMSDVLKQNPVDKLAREKGAAFVDLNEGAFRLVKVNRGLAVDGYLLAEPVLRSQALINLAKLKVHSVAGVTLCMKNLMGCILGGGRWDGERYHWSDYSDRRKIHSPRVHEALVDLNTVLQPSLNIIDGFIGQEGESPFSGEPVEMRTFIVSEDRVAADAVGARAMGIDPREIGHIRIGATMGLGEIDPEIEGDNIQQVRRDFTRPSVLARAGPTQPRRRRRSSDLRKRVP